MELTEKSTKFWTIMLLMVLGMSVLVMMIDFSIKGAILEESIRLRREIQSWKGTNGAKPEGRTDFSNPPDSNDNGPVSRDVLVVKPTRMEAGSTPNGAARPNASSRKRRTNGRTTDNNPGIQPGSE